MWNSHAIKRRGIVHDLTSINICFEETSACCGVAHTLLRTSSFLLSLSSFKTLDVIKPTRVSSLSWDQAASGSAADAMCGVGVRVPARAGLSSRSTVAAEPSVEIVTEPWNRQRM